LILVDSGVWIDYFKGTITPKTQKLDSFLGIESLAIGDLIVTEVLQGFGKNEDFNTAKRLLDSLTFVALGGREVAVKAASHFRFLRAKGYTIRKTVDLFIATRCLEDGLVLLHDDRDFDPFVKYLGLREVAS
jgi:predicted nucleic acid-binding protein